MTLVGDLISAVVGREKQDEGDDDAPVSAAADGGDTDTEADTIEVSGKRWPRDAAVRGALIEAETAAFERAEGLKIATLSAALSDAHEARSAGRRVLYDVGSVVGAQLTGELEGELSAALEAAWPAFLASGSAADALRVSAALARTWDREVRELGGTNTWLTGRVLARVVWGSRAGTPGDALLNGVGAALSAARSGTVPVVLRALGAVADMAEERLS
jgi:hypothetical protein